VASWRLNVAVCVIRLKPLTRRRFRGIRQLRTAVPTLPHPSPRKYMGFAADGNGSFMRTANKRLVKGCSGECDLHGPM